MAQQSWTINCLKMHKISDRVKKIITETMKHWKIELIAGGKTEVKIQRCILLEDALLPFVFAIAMIPLNHIFRNSTGGYKFTIVQENINYLNLDEIKLFKKMKK